MTLVNSKQILAEARRKKYGILSLLAGDLEMIVGQVEAAEALKAPLILAFNEGVTPNIPPEIGIPLMVNAARQARVPVATILDHGQSLEAVVKAIHFGSSSVMFDGSHLPYEENVRQTKEVVRVAHAVGVCVEAELGSIGGSAVEIGISTYQDLPDEDDPASYFTDPEVAVDFVKRTNIDVLAISFGNAHGVYQGQPRLDLDRVRKIHSMIEIPLVMHGASGLAEELYPQVIASGISKICYYTAMARGASHDLRRLLSEADPETLVYHNIIARSLDYFYTETKRLIELMGGAGTYA